MKSRSLAGMGALAITAAVALSGCQATQTRTESAGTQKVEQTQAAATTTQAGTQTESTVTAAAPTPESAPTGLAALAGHWSGKWGGGSQSTLTMTTDPDAVKYCYSDECWEIEGYTVDGNTLAWDNRGWKFSFTLKGDRLNGTLRNPRGTTRITMKRK